MNVFGLPNNSVSNEWLIFVGVLLVIGLAAIFFILWIFGPPTGAKKKHRRRKKRHYHRKSYPTLDQTGGLPPPRKPGEPPRGV